MTELIKIHDKNGKKLVSARDLHSFLESKQDFSTWIKARIEKYEFAENQDYTTFHKIVERAKRIEYALTIDMAKELSMVENNEKGKQARRYFIESENRYRALANPASLSRLQLLEMALESEKKALALQPKAEYADRVIETETKVDIGQAAKLLKLPFGRNTFFKKLREMGVFFKNRNEPRQEFIERGYFQMFMVLIPTNNHGDLSKAKIIVTQKGLYWLAKKFGTAFNDNIPALNAI